LTALSTLVPYTTLFRSLREEYEGLSYVADLIDAHGPEIVLYSGFTHEAGYEYTDKPLDRWECCVEYNQHDLQNQMIFTTEREARDRKSTRLNSSHVKTS